MCVARRGRIGVDPGSDVSLAVDPDGSADRASDPAPSFEFLVGDSEGESLYARLALQFIIIGADVLLSRKLGLRKRFCCFLRDTEQPIDALVPPVAPNVYVARRND